MKTFLPPAFLTVFVFFLSVTFNNAHAQCGGLNLLSNPGFESPAMPTTNSNNIMGPGVSWGGWDCTNGGLNILRVSGSGYASGANIAADGNQYVDVANSDGYISQQFVLAVASPIYFSGSFSNRESGWGNYVNWTGFIQILDANGTVVATSATKDFITSMDNETWYLLTGFTSSLPAGVYTYRSYIGNSGHFDNAAVCALANSVLPVKLESFTATAKEKNSLLEWVVSEEINVKQYEIQFSTDGKNFQPVNAITANNKRHYSMVHTGTVTGINYYRLKTIDTDGRFAYSGICRINFAAASLFSIYPNPSNGVVHLSLAATMNRKPGAVSVIAINGHVVMQQRYNSMNQNETLDISKLAPGSYVVRVTVGNEVVNKPLQVMR